jgi:hypothetical protein
MTGPIRLHAVEQSAIVSAFVFVGSVLQLIIFAQASPQGVPSETTSGGSTTGSALVNNEHEAARLSVGNMIR